MNGHHRSSIEVQHEAKEILSQRTMIKLGKERGKQGVALAAG